MRLIACQATVALGVQQAEAAPRPDFAGMGSPPEPEQHLCVVVWGAGAVQVAQGDAVLRPCVPRFRGVSVQGRCSHRVWRDPPTTKKRPPGCSSLPCRPRRQHARTVATCPVCKSSADSGDDDAALTVCSHNYHTTTPNALLLGSASSVFARCATAPWTQFEMSSS